MTRARCVRYGSSLKSVTGGSLVSRMSPRPALMGSVSGPARLSRALPLPKRHAAGPAHASCTPDKYSRHRRARLPSPPRWRCRASCLCDGEQSFDRHGRTLKAYDKSPHSAPPTECGDLSSAFSRRPWRSKLCAQNQLASHVARRLRESSCCRLLSGETAAQAAARAAAGPYQLGWVPCGSRLGRTWPAGPALHF